MAANIIAKASTTLLFGIDAGIVAISGFIANDADYDYSAKTVDAFDDQGSTVAVSFFDQMIEIKFNGLIKSGTAIPVIGSTITIATVMYTVMKVAKKEKNNNFTYLTMDLKRWSDNLVPNV